MYSTPPCDSLLYNVTIGGDANGWVATVISSNGSRITRAVDFVDLLRGIHQAISDLDR